jgi:hypothetical protein
MILLIDNYDSFVWNLARYVSELGHKRLVLRNDTLDLDLDEVLDEAEAVIVELLPAPGRQLAAVLGVDVDRTDEPLLPERALRRHGAADLADANVRDPHRCAPAQVTGVRAPLPSNHETRLPATHSPMARIVSSVLLATCGVRTTLSRRSRASGTFGSS